MNLACVCHRAAMPMAWPIGENELRVVLKACKDDLSGVNVYYGDRYAPLGKDDRLRMDKEASDGLFDYFTARIHTETRRVRYIFRLRSDKEIVWYTEEGFKNSRPRSGYFQYPYICLADIIKEPSWIRGRTMYQIFPDRFHNGNTGNDPKGCLKWGVPPKADSFFGGDLKGITDKLDYLSHLGIGIIYMTPIFRSPSNHKYDTIDYYDIDPAFGSKKDLKMLVCEAHARDIKVILDGVFNHCGKDFFAFRDVVDKGEKSKYKDWFNIYKFPVYVGENPNYETFANGIWTMPKLMTQNPEVREYLLDVGEYWIREADIDGWRLDVANEIDHAFWREFRKRIKAVKSDAFIIGEVWHDSLEWLRGDQFDSVMNYPWREAVLDFFARGNIDAEGFDNRLTRLRMSYHTDIWPGLLNLLGSHDTPRIKTLCGDARKSALAAVFMLTYHGLPMVYYGDEIGIKGKGDPDCRRTFPWDERVWDNELRGLYEKLIKLRRTCPEMSDGNIKTKYAKGNVYAYTNSDIFIVINNSGERMSVPLVGVEVGLSTDIISGRKYMFEEKRSIETEPYSAAVIVQDKHLGRMIHQHA
ncbi:glycoside hydrolase family 13 protein [Mahella sp.]|uniref:glycoside hydrolase family 13 protein n=1 Tax=Mahella sp. TaxID=2798721 RepID=UPI0025BC4875|nr:glycoside hydrolase family 13 protein [Mahella sp.]MBZ4665960.1 glycosidase [Mahella sp.]